MKLSEKTTIEKEKLIIVEGADDERFIELLLKKIEIQDVDIVNIGGNNFSDDIPEIGKISGFDIVKQLVVISDADNNANRAFNRIKNAIENIEDYELIPPQERNTFTTSIPKVGIFIITKPDSEEGMLEDLCLDIVKDHIAMDCVDKFTECLSDLNLELKNPSKSKCQTFLSAMVDSVPHIGIAAQRKYWDFDSEALNEIKSFLLNLKR